MRALPGVAQAGVVAGHAQHGSGHADANARFVHHVEHAGQTLARLANPVSHRAGPAIDPVATFAKVKQGIGRAAPAQLVVQADEDHIVALAGQLALGIDQVLGHDEQGDALDSGRQAALLVGDLGQHQVHDVLG